MTNPNWTEWGKTKSISSKTRNDTGCPLSPLLIKMVPELLAREIRESIKGI
jgi:hypothetical protein